MVASRSRRASILPSRQMNNLARIGDSGLFAAPGHHGAGLLVRAEFVGILDRHQFGQPRARAVDARLDGADGAATDSGGFFVRESRGPDQYERLALVGRQVRQRLAEFPELDAAVL